MKKIMLPAILLVVFMISFTSAFINLNIYVDNSGEALFLGETDKINLNLPSGITLEDGEIIGTTQSLTNKNGEIWNFNYNLPNSEINVILPENSEIRNSNAENIGLDRNQLELFFVGNVEITYIIGPSNNPNLIPIAIVVIIILVIIYFYLRNKVKREKISKKEKILTKKPAMTKEKKLEIVKQTLSEREKIIIDKLKEVKKIKHSRLQKIIGIPKASFSRHVQELEKKRIIKRAGDGKNRELSLRLNY